VVMAQWIEVVEGFLESVIFNDEYILHVSVEWMKLQDLGSKNFRHAWNMLGAVQNWICCAQWVWRKCMSFFFNERKITHAFQHWTSFILYITDNCQNLLQDWGQLCLLWPLFLYIEVTNVASLKIKDRACYSQTYK
jgi:hypothetical protein